MTLRTGLAGGVSMRRRNRPPYGSGDDVAYPDIGARHALHLAVLGPPAARWGERAVAFRTRKEFALLVYLALTHAPQPRDRLAALFWPDRDEAAARNLLRTTLSRLRHHLAAAG